METTIQGLGFKVLWVSYTIWVILGLYRDNGKVDGNNLGFRV